MASYTIQMHVERIQDAMKNIGVWSESTPAWVNTYDEKTNPDLWQWLQYIYLPMRLKGNASSSTYLAPQITSYLNQNPAFAPLLQLIIELDALTPTFHTSKM